MAVQPLEGLGIFILGVSRSQSFRNTSLGRNLVDERLAGRRELYMPTHNIHKRQKSMTQGEFKPAVPANERPHTQALDRVLDRKKKFKDLETSKLKRSVNNIKNCHT